MKNRKLLWFECISVFVVVPLLFLLDLVTVYFLTIPLIIITLPAVIWLYKQYKLHWKIFWVDDRESESAYLKVVLWRFAILSLLLLAIVLVFYPQRLFDLPLHNTKFWLMFIIVYPLLSVYPQELLYRAFFLNRYKALFSSEKLLIVVNAALFSWMHIVFSNLVIMLYTFVGGLLFAYTYQRTRSLRLVCLEHSMYGILLFSIGHGKDLLTSALVEKIVF